MKVSKIFEKAIEIGVLNDPRGSIRVKKILLKRKAEYKELSDKNKSDYDLEKLTNPYPDSGLHYLGQDLEVKRVLVGIDIGVEEVLLAKELERAGKKIDLIIGHHPEGKALTNLHEVMDIQIEVLAKAGLPENIAEGVLTDRISQVSRTVSPINHYKAIDAAKLLQIPFLNIHTPADNCVWQYVDQIISTSAPQTLGEIIEILKNIPEYKIATTMNAGPVIFSGKENSRAGKIVVTGMTGGTEGSEKMFERMSHYGIGTEIGMHLSEKHREEASKHYINVIVAGHMASDSLGMNLIIDQIEKEGVEIIACSGYIRFKRS